MGSVSVPASTGDPEVHGLAPRIHPWAVQVSIHHFGMKRQSRPIPELIDIHQWCSWPEQ